MLTEKKISIIPICYGDEGSVQEMYNRITEIMRDVTPHYEIIYVNDCSPDNARSLLKELAARDNRLTVITHARNFNSQMAFTSGLRYCTGDAAITIDGDLQDPPSLFPTFVRKWLEGYQVVYGIRVSREESRLLHLLRKIFYRTLRAFSYVHIPVDAGDFCLLDRRVIDVLNAMPERDRFFRGLRSWVGFRQVGVPYHRLGRFDGRKPYSSLCGYFWYAKNGIFSFSRVPLEFLSYVGLFFTACAFFAIVGYLVSWLLLPDEYTPSGFITLYIFALFFGGIQLLSISIVGEYVGKIFEEVKRRPPYIIDDIINDHRRWMTRRSDGKLPDETTNSSISP